MEISIYRLTVYGAIVVGLVATVTALYKTEISIVSARVLKLTLA